MNEVVFPGTLQDALLSSSVRPGDRLLLKGGTYKGNWYIAVGGTADKPVTIRPYGNEVVVIDGSIEFAAPYVHICDMEITDSNPDRYQTTKGITMGQVGCWIIGCHIHDLHYNGVEWFSSGVGGVVECWIHDNGMYYADDSGHGHGIYTHNHNGGARFIARNLFGNSIGAYAFQIYSGGDNYLRDYTVEDNVIAGDPVHCGGGLGLVDYVCQRNILYGGFWNQGRYSSQPNQRGLIQDNLFINLAAYSVQGGYVDLVEKNNLVWGGTVEWNWDERPVDGYIIEPMPARWSKFIPFTLSERWAGIQCTLTDGAFTAAMVDK
jgi:hypothetical protein